MGYKISIERTKDYKGYISMGNLLEVSKGSAIQFTIAITDEVTNTPVDLTNADILFMVKRDVDDPNANAVISKSFLTSGITKASDPTTGIVYLALSATDTKDLTARDYLYDIKTALPEVTPTDIQYPIKNEIFRLKEVINRTL